MVIEVTSIEKSYSSQLTIDMDGLTLEFRDGEPEDANLARDFNDCYSIVDAIKLAYNAGKNGEELTINYYDSEED